MSEVYKTGAVHRVVYTLDRFDAYGSELTRDHRSSIVSIVNQITSGLAQKHILVNIKIVGHAAYYDEDPYPKVPYDVQAQRRAEAVYDALQHELEARGVENRVEVLSITNVGTNDPATHNRTISARAKNRRVVVELSEIDTRSAPWKWICSLEISYAENVYSLYDPNRAVGGPRGSGVATGVLISDRHVLTSAHAVTALRRNPLGAPGTNYTWVRANKIKVTPGLRDAGHFIKNPFGTRKAKKIHVYPGFENPVSLGDYDIDFQDGTYTLIKEHFRTLRDLAIIELNKEFKQIGGWGTDKKFPVGIANTKAISEIAAQRDNLIRTAGYPEGRLEFSKGSPRVIEKVLAIVDIYAPPGHSGGPYWAKSPSGATRLVAIHKGESTTHGDIGVLLTPKKTKWINSVTQ